jgi:hypothetical protein
MIFTAYASFAWRTVVAFALAVGSTANGGGRLPGDAVNSILWRFSEKNSRGGTYRRGKQ